MKKTLFYSIAITCMAAFYSCKEKKTEPVAEKKPKDFLPVIDFLKSEINHIDTVPFSFTKYTTTGDKTDSAFIQKKEFHQLVDEFTEVDIRNKKYVDYYDETSLIDTITKFASFTYISNSDEMKVSRIDAYVDPRSQQFKKVFIKRNYSSGDTAFSKQLLWQTSGNFVLITVQTIGNTETIKQEKVVWDDKEE
jgi:hypothetical protein